ncbi:MAG TPA: undecaprenyl-diphosphatase, partial [Ruminococcaceae bacterium]|nr:undecaprenyl-diphosphatase [Oscillospiraceae bacterium]
FFLAIPVMAGASLLKLVKFFGKGNSFTLDQTVVLIVGCAVAFIVSIIAIRFLMDYVKRHTFTAFGVYRIALGIVVLVIWGVQTFVLKAPAAV